MSADTLDSVTFEPSSSEDLARVHHFFAAHEASASASAPRGFVLAGPNSGEQVELPEEVYRLLEHATNAMSRGMAVTIAPRSTTLTTSQAAELLGVSRPTVIKFLDEGRISFTKVNSHRRLSLHDVLAFQKARRDEQYAALEAMRIDVDDDAPIAEVLADLREARRVVGERRKARPAV